MRISAFVIAIVIALCSACRNDPAKVKSYTIKDTLPFQTATKVDLLFTDSARVKIHLKAPLIEEFGNDNPHTILSKGVELDFFDDSGAVNTSLTAKYAIRYEREQKMEARNDVVVVNIKGEKLNTEKLIWDGIRRKIYTDAFVKITTEDQILMGNGLESDETFSEYEIKNLTGTILLNDGE